MYPYPREDEDMDAISGVSSSGSVPLSIAVISRAELSGCEPWTSTFTDQRKDHRYYEILDDTLRDNFEYRYFVILDTFGRVRAVQPFFLVDQDILEGLTLRQIRWIAIVRRFYPRFLILRALMVGCSAGEAHLAASATLPDSAVAEALSSDIVRQARSLNAHLIVLKGISRALPQRPALLHAVRLCSRAKHANDNARHQIRQLRCLSGRGAQ